MATTRRPNILLLMSDQHSKHVLGCYGDALVRTPNLDQLGREGTGFTAAYCPAPLCVPSRMSFMTARRPSAIRVWSNNDVLASDIPTWAHSLGAAGYETALIGRMHFVGPDQRHGFELRPIGEYSATFPGADRLGGPLFRQISPATSGQTRISVEQAGHGRTTYQAYDEMVTETALEYLDAKAAEADGRPFAAVAGFVLPHCPFFAPKELFDYYYDRVDVPQPTAEELARQPAAIKRFKRLRKIDDPLPEERIRVARAAYYGMVEYLDRLIGRILQKLADTGLDHNTMVVYTTDHGEMAGEHGCWWKSNYYEGSVGVPLLARLPGEVMPARRLDAVCNLMDIGPTIIDMAGAGPLPAADGRSLWLMLCGNDQSDWPNETFSELLGGVGDPPSRMIRQGKWKLYDYLDEHPPALFDLAEDPDELTDLGASPEHATVRDGLLARLHEDWDPMHVVHESARRARDMRLITKWGQVVQPRHGDACPVPDVEDVVCC